MAAGRRGSGEPRAPARLRSAAHGNGARASGTHAALASSLGSAAREPAAV